MQQRQSGAVSRLPGRFVEARRPNRQHLHLGKAVRLAAVTVSLSVVMAGLVLVSPAAAPPLHFSGAAPGSVTCRMTAKVLFSPRLTRTGGGTSPSSFAGNLTGCAADIGAVTITRAKIKGYFATSPISCVTQSATGASDPFTITWRGSVTGDVGGVAYAGGATFTPTTVNAGVATGSFPGMATVTIPFPASLTSACGRRSGLREAALTGTVTLGGATRAGSLVSDSISDGGGAFCAVLTSGAVNCWGDNYDGALGNGSTTNSDAPVAVKGLGGTGTLTGVASLTSDAWGNGGYCAVLSFGEVDCWGDNSNGELGNASTTNSDVPVAVKGLGGTGTLTGVASLASDSSGGGSDGYCAVLTSGAVDCWGDNSSGDLGNGTNVGSHVPVAVEGLGRTGTLAGVANLVSGLGSYCAVLTSGAVDCWGDNYYGALGDGSTINSDVPVAVEGLGGTGTLTGVASLMSNHFSYCAVLTSGAVDCWGENFGALGNGSTTNSDFPVAVEGLGGTGTLTGVVGLAGDLGAGYCALLSSGTVDCWGRFYLGNGTPTNSDFPVAVEGLGGTGTLTGVASIISENLGAGDDSAGYCAVLQTSGVDCWGNNSFGRLGNGSTTNSDIPVAVEGPGGTGTLTGVVGLVSGAEGDGGGYAICAVLSSGAIDCWGYNYYGELGNGSTTNSDVPVAVSGIG
jgi:alpha-tubulin suppressor-like RCC1 family protein